MKKLKIFKQEILIITNRIIISKDSFIAIRNITRIWHGRPEVDIPIFNLIISFVLGIVVLGTPFSMIGWFIILGALIVSAYYIYILCNYTLNFELSSGEVYAFTSLDHEFIKNSYEKVKELMGSNELLDEQYQINFNSCKIDIVNGNNNEVYNGGQNIVNKGNNNVLNVNQVDNSQNQIFDSFNSSKEINYDILIKELDLLIKMPEVQSCLEDINTIQEARVKATSNDEKELKKLLKQLSKKTLDIINHTSSLMTIASFLGFKL